MLSFALKGYTSTLCIFYTSTSEVHLIVQYEDRVKNTDPWGLYYKHGLTSIPAWINNHMPSKVRNEITDSFPNINGCTVEVWEWMNNFIPHILMDVITYPCRD